MAAKAVTSPVVRGTIRSTLRPSNFSATPKNPLRFSSPAWPIPSSRGSRASSPLRADGAHRARRLAGTPTQVFVNGPSEDRFAPVVDPVDSNSAEMVHKGAQEAPSPRTKWLAWCVLLSRHEKVCRFGRRGFDSSPRHSVVQHGVLGRGERRLRDRRAGSGIRRRPCSGDWCRCVSFESSLRDGRRRRARIRRLQRISDSVVVLGCRPTSCQRLVCFSAPRTDLHRELCTHSRQFGWWNGQRRTMFRVRFWLGIVSSCRTEGCEQSGSPRLPPKALHHPLPVSRSLAR
jgi:hypothetical protein